jgi:RNA-directed DNA polymerase
MNEFDQFVKHKLKIEHYARYTDDIIIVSSNKEYLQSLIQPIELFLKGKLSLSLHPEKTIIKKYTEGVDFLGYVLFPHHILVRKRSKNRMLRKYQEKIKEERAGKIEKEKLLATLQSYLGMLSHANSYRLQEEMKNQALFLKD